MGKENIEIEENVRILLWVLKKKDGNEGKLKREMKIVKEITSSFRVWSHYIRGITHLGKNQH